MQLLAWERASPAQNPQIRMNESADILRIVALCGFRCCVLCVRGARGQLWGFAPGNWLKLSDHRNTIYLFVWLVVFPECFTGWGLRPRCENALGAQRNDP